MNTKPFQKFKAFRDNTKHRCITARSHVAEFLLRYCDINKIPGYAYSELETVVYKNNKTSLPQTVKIEKSNMLIENGVLPSKTETKEQNEGSKTGKWMERGALIGLFLGASAALAKMYYLPNSIMTRLENFLSSFSDIKVTVIVASAGLVLAGFGAAVGATIGIVTGGNLAAIHSKAIKFMNENRVGKAIKSAVETVRRLGCFSAAKAAGKFGFVFGIAYALSKVYLPGFYDNQAHFYHGKLLSDGGEWLIVSSTIVGLVAVSTAAFAALGAALQASWVAISHIAKTTKGLKKPHI